jgi:hypothetical protein
MAITPIRRDESPEAGLGKWPGFNVEPIVVMPRQAVRGASARIGTWAMPMRIARWE